MMSELHLWRFMQIQIVNGGEWRNRSKKCSQKGKAQVFRALWTRLRSGIGPSFASMLIVLLQHRGRPEKQGCVVLSSTCIIQIPAQPL